MARATWNGEIIAEADRFEMVEGNVYFPPFLREAGVPGRERHENALPLEGQGLLLHAAGERQREP